MAAFLQIMEVETSRIEEVEAFAKRMADERGDAILANQATFTADRDRPGVYMIIVEFDDYETAMRNSNDPEMAKYAAEMTSLLNGPPKFFNLDVRMVRTGRQ